MGKYAPGYRRYYRLYYRFAGGLDLDVATPGVCGSGDIAQREKLLVKLPGQMKTVQPPHFMVYLSMSPLLSTLSMTRFST
jgi:hypothetical protein